MTIELRTRVNTLKSQIEQRENAARETAHRIAKAQAAFDGENKQAIEHQPKPERVTDKPQKTSVRTAGDAEQQTHLIEEVTVIAKLAEERAFKAEKKALVAQREAMFANVIALITLTIAIAIFFNSGLI